MGIIEANRGKHQYIDFKGDDRDILIYAFRYALGRQTYSVSTIISIIESNIDILSDFVKKLFIREINERKEIFGPSSLGSNFDKVNWERLVIKLTNSLAK